jgi:hypothetical protein
MEAANAVIAVFDDHHAAETAVKKLTAAGFEMKHLSVVGKGYHTEERSSGSTISAIGSSSGESGERSGEVSGACSLAGCSWPFLSWAMSSSSDI